MTNPTTEMLSGFPVPVVATSSRALDGSAPDGTDLRFVDASGNDMPFDVEQWNADGTGLVWVRASLAGAFGETSFHVYWGGQSNTANDPATWAEFAAVYHLGNGGPATPSAPMLAGSGSLAYGPCLLARCVDFAGSSVLEGASTAAVENVFVNGGTISAWVHARSAGAGGYGRIVDKATGNTGQDGWAFSVSSAAAISPTLNFVRGRDVGYDNFNANHLLPFNDWHYVAIRYTDEGTTTTTLFQSDGTSNQAVQTNTGTGPGDPDVGSTLRIGNSFAMNRPFDGMVDEVRISSVRRSDAWLAVELISGSAPEAFVTFGPAENRPGG